MLVLPPSQLLDELDSESDALERKFIDNLLESCVFMYDDDDCNLLGSIMSSACLQALAGDAQLDVALYEQELAIFQEPDLLAVLQLCETKGTHANYCLKKFHEMFMKTGAKVFGDV